MSHSPEVLELQKEVERLKSEIAELKLKVPRGILQVCADCKNVKDPGGQWLPLDRYLALYTEMEVSHGYCEACVEKMLAETADEPESRALPDFPGGLK
ncbi:MAG: hypothetical protein LBO05_03675 [Deltaproteobacteria bacterium]|jgi:hypothetical protein|nr:hypothetical protein [Deltaproteobacteria bacterium]